jgi:threonine dehydrogenase-like Zn-dependent dehydrogenase
MRALVLHRSGVVFHQDWPTPQLHKGEVLVRVLRAGICETDLQLVQGYKGFEGVLGHEFVGIAESGSFAGRRVVGEINCGCLHCATCLAGHQGHCPDRTVLGILGHDGCFADLVAVPERNLHAVPDSISTDAAVFTEPLAAAFQIPAQIPLDRSQRVVILGDGRMGSLCAQVLARICDDVTVIGKHEPKLTRLALLGLNARSLDDRPSDRSADIVVDCTGSPTGLPTAISLVKPRGTIVLKTTVAGEQTGAWAPIVVDEITIVGSRCGPFDTALAALAAGRIAVDPLISTRFPLEKGVDAMAAAAGPSTFKVLLDVS